MRSCLEKNINYRVYKKLIELNYENYSTEDVLFEEIAKDYLSRRDLNESLSSISQKIGSVGMLLSIIAVTLSTGQVIAAGPPPAEMQQVYDDLEEVSQDNEGYDEESPIEISEDDSKMSKAIYTRYQKFKSQAESSNLPKFSAAPEAYKLVVGEMLRLEKLFEKAKDNRFLYSMLITALMNSSEGVSRGRSSALKITYTTQKQRYQMFSEFVLKRGSNDKLILKYLNNTLSDKEIDALIKTPKEDEAFDTFRELEDMMLQAQESRFNRGGQLGIWLSLGNNPSEISKGIDSETLKKDREHWCGGGVNTLLQVLKEKFGDLEIPDKAFNSVTKFRASSTAQKTFVFDIRAFVGIRKTERVEIVKKIVRRGMIVVLKNRHAPTGGHFGYVEEVKGDNIIVFNTNSSKIKTRSRENGLGSVSYKMEDVAILSAMQPMFSKSSRDGLAEIMNTARKIRHSMIKKSQKRKRRKKRKNKRR